MNDKKILQLSEKKMLDWSELTESIVDFMEDMDLVDQEQFNFLKDFIDQVVIVIDSE